MQHVDIYSVELDAPDPQALSLIPPQELAQATRFRFERDRRRFLHCRAALRRILADYLAIAPPRIEIRTNRQGKPQTRYVHFNVSHSQEFALIAVSRTREVGIDVEKIDAKFMRDNIAENFFSPREVAELRALPEADRTQAFFNCWTRKEAYVKARGLGLSLALSSFDVTLAPGAPAAFLRGVGDWSIESIEAKPGYSAAVVAYGLETASPSMNPASEALNLSGLSIIRKCPEPSHVS